MSLNHRPAETPGNTARSGQGSSLEVSIPCPQPLGMHKEMFMGDVHDRVL